MGRLRLVFCLICALALVAFTAACADTGAGDGADAEAPQEPDARMDSATELNFDTLQADTPEGTLQAKRADNSYVGSIGDGRAIGIAFLDEVSAGENQDHHHEIVVYLYDREDLAVLIGEVDSGGAATLQSGELSDFEATVELTMEGDVVSGTASFPGEEPTSFTANAATGIAGVYWAHGTEEEPDVSADWVVLSDGRQWGCVCFPPYTGPCCQMRF